MAINTIDALENVQMLATNDRYDLVRHPVPVRFFSDRVPPVLDFYVFLAKEEIVLSSQVRDIAFYIGRIGDLATNDDHLRIANDIAGRPSSTSIVRTSHWRIGIYLYFVSTQSVSRGFIGSHTRVH
jgi:hypothetical protein